MATGYPSHQIQMTKKRYLHNRLIVLGYGSVLQQFVLLRMLSWCMECLEAGVASLPFCQ